MGKHQGNNRAYAGSPTHLQLENCARVIINSRPRCRHVKFITASHDTGIPRYLLILSLALVRTAEMSANLDLQARASYEHRKVLLQLSDNLSNKDCRKIVYLEGLSKELLGENNYWDPLNVLLHLEMRGKTTPEELIRILNDINRQDVAKLIAKTKKNPLTRKNSGAAPPKLEDSLNLTMKNCEVLLEQTEVLIKLAASKGNKRIEEVVSEAKTNLTDGVQHKLKYAFRLFSSQSQSEHCGNFSNSSPPGPSPESSLTSKVSPSQSADLPSSPVHQCLPINKSDLKRAVGKLKPLGIVTQRGEGCKSL